VEVCALDSAVDWNEGDKNGAQAAEGESCFTAAQFGVKQWQTAAGKDVNDIGALLYDKAIDEILTKLNSKSLEISRDHAGQPVTFELDEEVVKHLAASETCRGLVLFHRDRSSKVGFFSMDQHGKGSSLTVTAK
jgi:hypothetical protein